MKREILFRGMRKNGKGWAYGDLVHDAFDGHSGEVAVGIIRSRNCYPVEVKPETVGQFTGLNDPNGIEVFEGDKFHMGDPNITYAVMWHDTGLMGKQNGSSSYVGLEHWIERITVTGNIHETTP